MKVRRIRTALARSEPLLLLLGALITLAMAFWGFEELRSTGRLGDGASASDSLYQAVELFRDPAEWYHVPWQLGVARFMALVVVGFAVVHLLSNVIWSQRDRLRIRFARGHAIVCGIGEIALTAAGALVEEHGAVAVVAKDPTPAQLREARDRRTHVIVDDPRTETALQRAGVRRAKVVLAATYDDANNIEIASVAARIAREGSPMRCIAHVRDLRIRAALCERELRSEAGDSCRIEFCNVYDASARTLLAALSDDDLPERVALVGNGPSLDGIVHHLALRRESAGRSPLGAWLVRDDAEVYARALDSRGFLPQACEIVPVPEPVVAYPDLAIKTLRDLSERERLEAVYISLESDSDTVGVSRMLAEKVAGVSVVALVWRYVRLGELLRGDLEHCGEGGLTVHHVLGSLGDGSALTSAFLELLARRIHGGWLQRELARGSSLGSTPAMMPWERLDPDLREANFAQAGHIVDTLTAIGAEVVPASSGTSRRAEFAFTEGEVERLAQLEHERWMKQRTSVGWKWGALRNYEARTHPSIVDYDNLSEVEKQKDRDAVLDIPAILEGAGFRAVR